MGEEGGREREGARERRRINDTHNETRALRAAGVQSN